jgi:hypothetical protein
LANISLMHFRNRELCWSPYAPAVQPVAGWLYRITEGVVMDDCLIALENTRASRRWGSGFVTISARAIRLQPPGEAAVTELKIDRSLSLNSSK